MNKIFFIFFLFSSLFQFSTQNFIFEDSNKIQDNISIGNIGAGSHAEKENTFVEGFKDNKFVILYIGNDKNAYIDIF